MKTFETDETHFLFLYFIFAFSQNLNLIKLDSNKYLYTVYTY